MRPVISRRARPLVVIAVTLALFSIPTSYVFASHVFSDVSGGAYYHDSVTAVFNAGITAGCSPTKYCPNNPVTRGQMAVFMNLLGGLSLGPGGQPHTKVDALSDQGTQVYRFFQNVSLTGAGPTACSPLIPVGPKPANFGSYSITHRLYATPVGINPEQVNVQIRDADDATPDEYEICLATLDGSSLPNGLYRTFGTEMVFIGQNTFAD